MTSRPNFLIIMVDQLNGTFFPDGPADWLRTPNLRRLASNSVRFKNAYTASPLCAPGRAAFMSGQLPSQNGVYDNAAEFSSTIPTYAHHLRRAGYQTCLSGKMHFVGPDQLHGFEERLTTDIYPADFGWTPDYSKPDERIDWWYHNLGSVTGSGISEISNQLEYDDEVAFNAKSKIYDLARGHDPRPWCLTVSFTHPHDPYVARKKYWDLYEDCSHLLPEVSKISYENHDLHSKRIFDANDWRSYEIDDVMIERSRRAYFANISYLDDQIGELLKTLEETDQEAIIIFVSDHGDMLGERGLWFKMSFFEGSARVPLMISASSMSSQAINSPVSTIDLCPTICELAGVTMSEVIPWITGESLCGIMQGEKRKNPVLMEYAAEASHAPMVCIRKDRWKYTFCSLDPEQLFDLDKDPHELDNLIEKNDYKSTVQFFRETIGATWNLDRFDQNVRESQAKRKVVYEALRKGGYYPWDFQPLKQASERYMRNHMDLNILESSQRYPSND
jgi:choline-sulfatase